MSVGMETVKCQGKIREKSGTFNTFVYSYLLNDYYIYSVIIGRAFILLKLPQNAACEFKKSIALLLVPQV